MVVLVRTNKDYFVAGAQREAAEVAKLDSWEPYVGAAAVSFCVLS
jgi:hypothetical protein